MNWESVKAYVLAMVLEFQVFKPLQQVILPLWGSVAAINMEKRH